MTRWYPVDYPIPDSSATDYGRWRIYFRKAWPQHWELFLQGNGGNRGLHRAEGQCRTRGEALEAAKAVADIWDRRSGK